MLDRKHIEQILKVNGLGPDSPDDEIKSVLISARWHEKDVDTALIILREDPKKKVQHITTTHQVFNTSEKISPDTLNAILGIDVNLSDADHQHRDELRKSYKAQIFSIAVISVIGSIAMLAITMWYLHVGIFYDGI